jgi:5-amino-6-(5-phosphoribosylamino)uracil reductase
MSASFPQRPQTTVVLAISADGKIADAQRSSPKFGSASDYAHLEQQVAIADGVLFGATTLRAGGTAMRVQQQGLIQQRLQQQMPEQPVQIVCSRTADLDPELPFFKQPIPRWLVTSAAGASRWHNQPGFDQVIAPKPQENPQEIDWSTTLLELGRLGLSKIAVLGGGEIIAALLAEGLIDDLWLTVCPVLLGGTSAPTPVAGDGFAQADAPRLELVEFKPVDQEIFLHYRVKR